MLFAAIRRAVADAHEVDPFAVVLVRPASLPRTTSGKLQRLKTREMFSSGELAAVAGWSGDDAQGNGGAEAGGLVAALRATQAAGRSTLLRQVLG